KMLLGRLFSYPDAHRYRIGANYKQLPVNAPVAPVHKYGQPAGWHTDGDMVRTAYILREDNDDWSQAGTMVREVLDDDQRARLVDNIVGHLLNGVSEPVLERAFDYWHNVDKELGDRIEAGVRTKQEEKDPKAADQGNPARSSMQRKA
ncbi:catalase-related domain-containing protein, partial [Amycolatopsis sp. NPDC004169]|uniref:catalase-related domain-containing protein n=1 Tax=Amycolatopsis sp. NPDC004169 TaxID=3154453 RepID=UPI0033BCE3BE